MILSPDDLLPDGPARWTKATVGEAWAECHRGMRAALLDPGITTAMVLVGCPGSGKSTWAQENDEPGLVMFDACWAESGRRAGIARQIRAAGREAVAVWVRTPLEVCRERNSARPPERRVPDAALVRSWLSLRARPPTLAEGWTRVLVVDGSAQHQDAQAPEVTIRRAAMAPSNQAWALVRARVLPAYRAAQERGTDDVPPRLAQSLRGLGAAMGRGVAADERLGPALGKAGQRIEARQRQAWEQVVREQVDGWTAEPQDDLVSDWTERVAEQIGSVRARVAPGIDQAVREAWAKGWTAAQLEASWREHGLPLDGGGTAEGQGSTIGRDAANGLAQEATWRHQEAVGSDEYDWQHSGAANPDPEHLAANGRRHRWSKRPAYGHPGERRNCGCSARPVVSKAVAARLRPEAEVAAVAPTGKRKPARAAPGGGGATEALRAEIEGHEHQRERVLGEVARRLGPEAAAELRALAKRQRAATGGRRGVTPSGERVTDPQDSGRQRDRWIKGLTDEQREAMRDWSSEQWFGLMRSTDSGREATVSTDGDARWVLGAERRMTAMREALASAPRYEGEMARGIRDLPRGSALRKALSTRGAVVEMESATSWSPDERTARSFADDSEGSFLLRVITRRGAVVGDERVSYTAREAEIMLDRGARFRVVSTAKRPGDDHRRLVVLEELDPA